MGQSGPEAVFELAIVGAGASGTILAIQALETGISRLVLIERAPVPGLGVAYAAVNPHHTLNVLGHMMGGRTDADTDGLVRWAAPRLGRTANELRMAYLPRQLYGTYLRDLLAQAVAAAPDRIALHHGEAIDIEPIGAPEFWIVMADGRRFRATRVALCLGNPDPSALVTPADDRVVEHPWRRDALQRIGAADSVLAVGAGLTTVDTVTELTDRGHRGAVTVISRHGLLPLPDGPVVSYGDFFDPSLARHKIRAVMWRLRAEIAVAAKAGIDWHSVVEAFRIHASQIWIGLADRERRRFLRHLHTLWLAHRHRMPPEQAEIIDAAVVVGRLRIVAGRLRAITAGAGGIKVTFRERGSDQDTLLSVEALINCTGPDWDVARTTSRLVATMIDRGLLRGDEYGLGLDVDESLRARDRQGRPVPGLYVIGPPTRGRFWEVVAVPHLRQQIERILAEWQRRI